MNDTTLTHGRVIGNDAALHRFAMQPKPASRASVNWMFGIGLIVFAWLILAAFSRLKRMGTGWAYFLPFLVCYAASRTATDGGGAAFAVLGMAIYVAGWVHANRVLTGYETHAAARIEELAALPERSTDDLLEQGILEYRVAGRRPEGLVTLARAAAYPAGDPALLGAAAEIMAAANRGPDAAALRGRALHQRATGFDSEGGVTVAA
jgi:hypothetical protein